MSVCLSGTKCLSALNKFFNLVKDDSVFKAQFPTDIRRDKSIYFNVLQYSEIKSIKMNKICQLK